MRKLNFAFPIFTIASFLALFFVDGDHALILSVCVLSRFLVHRCVLPHSVARICDQCSLPLHSIVHVSFYIAVLCTCPLNDIIII